MAWWHLTNTTYGTWLPGDPRGSVTSVRDHRKDDPRSVARFEHDRLGQEYEPHLPGLHLAAIEQMKGPPIYLDLPKAELILQQFRETATHRKWPLRAVAIMCSHWHLVVRAPDELDPNKLLGDFKAYGSRALNRTYGMPPSETWWTRDGSKRKIGTDGYLKNAVNYVLYEQELPLVVWGSEEGRIV
jgi:REP element-mobilizing transposase RayT